MSKPKRYTVTAALPYANGPIHIGQLAGAYISPDIYVRHLRNKGEDVVFICGSDEHGVAIVLKAMKEGVKPEDIVEKYHTLNRDSFEQFGISFDIFHRTSSDLHHQTASSFFSKLHSQGQFIEKSSAQYFDESQQQFLADRYIIGTCPNCGNQEAYGDQCENCGSSLSPDELLNPKSAFSGEKPIRKETKHWYLPLNEYETWLKKWLLDGHSDWKKNVYGQCKSWIEQGLQPRAMTRDLDWGVKVPLKEAEGKVLYVWLDAPIGYITATKAWASNQGIDWEPYWKDEETALLHFIGKDNIVFHCIIFPILLKAHGQFILPLNVPANEFMNMEGRKISTSKNWAVWLHEYLEDFPGKEDVLRYVLTSNMPETKDSEFTWLDFQSKNNNELVAVLGNFVNRVFVLFDKYFESKVPALPSQDDEKTIEVAKRCLKESHQFIESFRFRDALNSVMEIARIGNKYLADQEPWKTIKSDEVKTASTLATGLAICAILTEGLIPLLPNTSIKLAEALNSREAKNFVFNTGHQIENPGLLFDQIEDEVVQAQIEKLKRNSTMDISTEESKPQINFEQFSALDLKVGKVLEAKKVEKADKLIQFLVDLGSEKRTILSGVAEHFDPIDLIGKQVTVLTNLAPRKIRGIESQGMILLAEDENGLSFIGPDRAVNPGANIS